MFIESLGKGLTVLEAFEPDRPALTLSELASKTGFTIGSVQRITSTLRELGYLERDDVSKAYRVGSRVLLLTRSYMQSVDLQRASQGPMRDLAEELGTTVTVGVRSGLETVYVLRVSSKDRAFAPNVWIGSALPLQFTSIGKALIAFLEPSELDALLAQIDFPMQSTTRTVTKEEFKNELCDIRVNGFAINDRDLRPDVRSAAAPVFNHEGEVLAALGVAASADSQSLEELRYRYSPRLVAAAREISANLGHMEGRIRERHS